jgi:azurin
MSWRGSGRSSFRSRSSGNGGSTFSGGSAGGPPLIVMMGLAFGAGLIMLIVMIASNASTGGFVAAGPRPTAAPRPTATPRPTPAPAAAQPTRPPAAQAANAPGGSNVVDETPNRTIEVRADPNALAFVEKSLSVPANTVVRLDFINENNLGVQHNWVLVNGGDDVAAAVNTAAQNNADGLFVPPPDTPNALAWTAMLNVGQTGSVTFRTPPPGTYLYICTFPGHYQSGMKGTLTVTQ